MVTAYTVIHMNAKQRARARVRVCVRVCECVCVWLERTCDAPTAGLLTISAPHRPISICGP